MSNEHEALSREITALMNKLEKGARNRPRRHHFIPKMHLKHFVGHKPNGHVWTYDAHARDWRSGVPEETAVENHFNSYRSKNGEVDVRVELLLAHVEDLAAPVYVRLLKDLSPTDDDKLIFSMFLAFMVVRTPLMRRQYARGYSQFVQTKAYQVAKDNTSFEEQISIYERELGRPLNEDTRRRLREAMLNPSQFVYELPKEATVGVLELAGDIAPHFFRASWQIAIPESGYFITSDNPVAKSEQDKKHGSEAVCRTAHFPLCPHKLLVMTARVDKDRAPRLCSREQVRAFNCERARCAERFLFGHLRDKRITRLPRGRVDLGLEMTLPGGDLPAIFGRTKVVRKVGTLDKND